MGRILSVTITPFKFQFYIDLYVQVISYRDLVLQNPHSFLVPDMQRDESALNLAFVCKKPSGVLADSVLVHFVMSRD